MNIISRSCLRIRAVSSHPMINVRQARNFTDAGDAKTAYTKEEIEAERIRRVLGAADKAAEEQLKKNARGTAIAVGLGVLATYFYMGSTNTLEAKDGDNAFTTHNKRVWASLKESVDYWINPPSKKLLPDPLPGGYQRPYTLLIELSDTLCHMVWEKDDGWKAAIRPGAKQLLANLSRYYELVIFTTAPGYLGEPVAACIDPYQYATYRLYRDHTKLVDGTFVKDLSLLNRNLEHVILIDTDAKAFKLQPENGMIIKNWTGDENDKEMYRFETFLEELFMLTQIMGNKPDIRPLMETLKKYDAEDLPQAWKLHKDRLRSEFTKHQDSLKVDIAQESTLANSVFSVLGQLVGRGKLSKESAANQSLAGSANLVDVIENAARAERVAFLKEQIANKGKLEELAKEHEQKLRDHLEENKKKNLKLIDYIMGAGQIQADSPEDAASASQ